MLPAAPFLLSGCKQNLLEHQISSPAPGSAQSLSPAKSFFSCFICKGTSVLNTSTTSSALLKHLSACTRHQELGGAQLDTHLAQAILSSCLRQAGFNTPFKLLAAHSAHSRAIISVPKR